MRHMFDSKLTFKPFTLLEEFPFGLLSPLILTYPLSLQELGSDNTAYLDLFTNLIVFFCGP